MTPGQLKGTLLEYLLRQLLQNCGFTSVKPDGHYIYQQSGNGLFFINGKGAAHDADVLMEPPIQMPFSYPSQLLFECKAYETKTGLTVIRNALGLRYDINEFEIVTDDTIKQRQNNKRSTYAISGRKRYVYQVGVASVEDFSPPAFEFAANNKIPLLSFRWFLPDKTCDLFHTIDQNYLNSIEESLRRKVYTFLKEKKKEAIESYSAVNRFIEEDNVIGEILNSFNMMLDRSFVGLNETGDLIFLFANQRDSFLRLFEMQTFEGLKAQIHYYQNRPNEWLLTIIGDRRAHNKNPEFRFFVPSRIMSMWRESALNKNVAIDLKEQFFSRVFIFTGQQDRRGLPFLVVNIDQEWLDNIREQ